MDQQTYEHPTEMEDILEESKRVAQGAVASAEIEGLRRSYMDRARKRINSYRGSEQEYLRHTLSEIDETQHEQLRRIKADFDENSAAWVQQILYDMIHEF